MGISCESNKEVAAERHKSRCDENFPTLATSKMDLHHLATNFRLRCNFSLIVLVTLVDGSLFVEKFHNLSSIFASLIVLKSLDSHKSCNKMHLDYEIVWKTCANIFFYFSEENRRFFAVGDKQKMDKNLNVNFNSDGDDDTMSSVYNAWRKIDFFWLSPSNSLLFL